VSARLGMGIIVATAALTIASGSSQQAHADNTFGGASVTITQSAAPSTIDKPSAPSHSPVAMATDSGNLNIPGQEHFK